MIKRLFILLIILIALYGVFSLISDLPQFEKKLIPNSPSKEATKEKIRIVTEESTIINVVKNFGPSVITIGVEQTARSNSQLDPFSIFFDSPKIESETKERYIGSGFVIQKDGLIVTNKHVVSDKNLDYFIANDKGTKYEIDKIYTDPLNDLAILKVKNPPKEGFKEIELGNSDNLQVGQFVIAIGTALGEFRNTVTTGVISGLGRGITAGSPYEGYVERLDNVIQTDAAINPGNSGGPLLNSAGQVIGVNTAVAPNGQNIGFTIPINIVKESLQNFNETGQFNRPYLGIAYAMISKKTAILNDFPQGAYVQEVMLDTAAHKAGIKKGDIITKIDGKKIDDEDGGIAVVIAKKKIGDSVTVTIFRNDEVKDIKVTLQGTPEE